MTRPVLAASLLALTVAMAFLAMAEGEAARPAFVATALAAAALAWWGARRLRLTHRWVLGLALALRLVAFPLPPTLSDDAYRYLWDARRWVEHGESPYATRPSERRETDPELFERLNSPDYHSVYPPGSQAVFGLATWLGGGSESRAWWGGKALLLAAEVAGMIGLARVVSPAALALYAWSPVAVIEIAGQGHTEGLLVGALGLWLGWGMRRRRWAVAAAVAAISFKLWPVLAAPVALRRVGWKGAAVLSFCLCLAMAPVFWGTAGVGVRSSLALYQGVFDWYAPAYLALKAALWAWSPTMAGAWAARLLGSGVILWTLRAWVRDDGTERGGQEAAAGVVAAYVIGSPVLHPWHLLPLLFMSPLLQRNSIIWLVAWSLATYLSPAAGGPWYYASLAVGWGGALALWMFSGEPLSWLMRRRAASKWERLAPALGPVKPGARLLDLGAGEGYVGDLAAEATGAAVTLADEVDLRRSPRAWLPVINHRLDVGEGAFDDTVLVYVLHHAADPEALLREAVRVTRGRVVVLESVVRWKWTAPLLHSIDQLFNRMRSDRRMSGRPPAWRSCADWEAGFARNGWAVTRHDGVRGWLHPTALWTIEARPSTDAVRASSHTASDRRRNHVH